MSIPELGTVKATQIPLVFLTSNNTRELSEALKRRCLFLHLDYPSVEREREIVLTKVPGISNELADQVARIVRSLRSLDLKKHPSISETLDWARTLVLLGIESVDGDDGHRDAAPPAQVPLGHRRSRQGAQLRQAGVVTAGWHERWREAMGVVLDVLTGFVRSFAAPACPCR